MSHTHNLFFSIRLSKTMAKSDNNWIIKLLWVAEKSWFQSCNLKTVFNSTNESSQILFFFFHRQLPVPYSKTSGGATAIPLPATVHVTRRTPDKRSLPVPNGQSGIAKYPSGTPSSENSRPNSPPDFKSGIRWVQAWKLLSKLTINNLSQVPT